MTAPDRPAHELSLADLERIRDLAQSQPTYRVSLEAEVALEMVAEILAARKTIAEMGVRVAELEKYQVKILPPRRPHIYIEPDPQADRIAELEAEVGHLHDEVGMRASASDMLKVADERDAAVASVRELGRCRRCAGLGKIHMNLAFNETCHACSGSGWHPTAQKVLGIEREGT